jgi:methionyl-tRNA formyltransferase
MLFQQTAEPTLGWVCVLLILLASKNSKKLYFKEAFFGRLLFCPEISSPDESPLFTDQNSPLRMGFLLHLAHRMKSFESLRIVFMGTPVFAVSSLEALLKAGANVVGVVTAPDKPAGRGMQMQESAVKQFAVANQLPVLQPEKLKSPEFIDALAALKADLQVVVAFRMLPEIVWNMPPFGTINVHASLLPQYRGAAPINWAIINGETVSGVTTFKLQHAIDTGNLLLQQKVDLSPTMNAGQLHDLLMLTGADLLVKTLHGIANGTIEEKQQPSTTDSKHAPKIFTATCQIDCAKDITTVCNLVRGLSPYPAAYTKLNGKQLKIFDAEKISALVNDAEIGQFKSDGKTYLHLACKNGYLAIHDLQLEGKKKMTTIDFLRGNKI